MILYDIINLKPEKIRQKDKKISDTDEAVLQQNAGSHRLSVSDTDNVPQSGDVVNRQYMQSERNYPQSILDRDAQRVWAQMEGYGIVLPRAGMGLTLPTYAEVLQMRKRLDRIKEREGARDKRQQQKQGHGQEVTQAFQTGVEQWDNARIVAQRGFHTGNQGDSEAELNKQLMNELAESGVKYNVDDVVMLTKNFDGKLLWLEKGNGFAGLKHIVDGHAADFTAKGVNDIPKFLNEVLNTEAVKVGTGAKGPFAEYIVNGTRYRVAYGTNGYIVSFYPID